MLTREEYIYNQIVKVAAFIVMLIAIIFLALVFILKWEYFKPIAIIGSLTVAALVALTIIFSGIVFYGLVCAFKIRDRVASTNKILVAYAAVSIKIAQKILGRHGGPIMYSEEDDEVD